MDQSKCIANTILLCLLVAGKVFGQDNEKGLVSIGSLTEESCSQKREGCCSDLFIGDSPSIIKCLTIHADKIPAGSQDSLKVLKFFSCFVECFYKKNKFIGKNNTLNMKMVQLEAENLYAEQPKEKEYFVATYEKCQPIVSEQYNTLMTSPPAKAALKPMCRPFFSLLHLCFMEYHKKNECPYFRWQKNGKSEESTACKQARNKCYEIDGIRPHESHTRNV